jgi:hypothetical protein
VRRLTCAVARPKHRNAATRRRLSAPLRIDLVGGYMTAVRRVHRSSTAGAKGKQAPAERATPGSPEHSARQVARTDLSAKTRRRHDKSPQSRSAGAQRYRTRCMLSHVKQAAVYLHPLAVYLHLACIYICSLCITSACYVLHHRYKPRVDRLKYTFLKLVARDALVLP